MNAAQKKKVKPRASKPAVRAESSPKRRPVSANASHGIFSEAILLESEELFRVTFEQAAVGIAHVSPEGKFLRVNRKFCDIVGYSLEEMRERTFQDITCSDDLAADVGQAHRLLAGATDNYAMEKRYVRKDGGLVWVYLTVSLVRDAAGRPRWFVSIVEDISERKRVQQELENRLKFEKLLMAISTRLSDISIDRLDDEILEAQRQICECLALDVCVLWQISSPGRLQMSHLYGPPDFPALLSETRDAQTGFPWCLAKVMNKETIVLSRISDAPAAAARDQESWRHYGLRSVLTFPLFAGGGPPFGAINFSTMTAEREWSPELVGQLRIVAQIIANALNRKFTERGLRESEAQLKLAAESASAGLWSWDYRSGKIWVTDQTRRLYGFSPDEEITAERYERTLHPDDVDRVRLVAEEGFRRGAVVQTEYRVVLPDKSIRWVGVRAQGLMDPSGRPASMKGVSLDVTERKEAELALAESERRYRMLFESAPAGIILIGPDGRVRAANSLQTHLYRYDSPRELEGFYAPLFVAEKDRERAARNMREQLAGDDLPGRTYTCVRRDGSEFLAEVTSIALLGPGQDVHGYLCMTRDITREKQGESERIELRHELAHLARVMTMNELSTSLAHEINQPLGAILNNAQAVKSLLAKAGEGPGEVGEIVDDIIQDVQRAGDVVRKIRGIVKKSDAKFEPLSVNALIEEVLRLISNSLAMNNVTLRLDLGAGLPDVRGDRVRLQQILLNLMTNAIEAMKEASPRVMEVRSAAAADAVVVSVGDTGTGLDQAGLDNVFKPFFTTKKDGLGMGLTICQSIIEEHGGRIWAENKAAGGATFHFALKASGESPLQGPDPDDHERRRFARPARPPRGT
jgi:PAS domain S-box-containing protein